MERAKIVDHYLQQIGQKDFNIYKVRQELEKNGFQEEEIRIIVRLVDSELQRQLLKSDETDRANQFIWLGGLLTLVGLGVTLGTYLDVMDAGGYYLLAYGPVFGGLGLLFAGVARKRGRNN